MKRGISALLAVLLCVFAGGSLADDYGEAVVDGGAGHQVHLRAQPSSGSESLGVYFTGTSVTLRSDPDEAWVKVKIGRESGYMRSGYLRRGAAADRVETQFWAGTVNANKYARMRKGPSTEYQFICNVNDGENLTIMGKTDENWYYVQYKGEKGFISANLIYTRGVIIESEEEDEGYSEEYEEVYSPVPTYAPVMTWQQAYRSYISNKADKHDTFALIYLNDDNVPELVIDSGVEAEGCRILTYASGQVNVLTTRRLGFTYIERGNRLCNSDGSMDSYYDDVYEIQNGRWVCIARGEYYGYLSGWNDILGRYVCQNYIWNGQKTNLGQYMISLSNVYDTQRAVGVEDGYSLGGIISKLAGVTYR